MIPIITSNTSQTAMTVCVSIGNLPYGRPPDATKHPVRFHFFLMKFCTVLNLFLFVQDRFWWSGDVSLEHAS